MASNIKKFKCLIHFNETQRGSILSEDLTYSMLHEMVMQKFKLEANAVINLSFKLSSFDFAVDITDDAEVTPYLRSLQMSSTANDEFSQHLSDDEASNHEDASDTGAAPKQQQQAIPQTSAISNIKLLILKKKEYDIWVMEMEHYLEYIDNEVWKKIQMLRKKGRTKNICLWHSQGVTYEKISRMVMQKKIWKSIRTSWKLMVTEVSNEDAKCKVFSGDPSTCTPSTSLTNIPEKEARVGFADEVIYSLFAKQSEDWDLLHEDLEQINDLDIEEMDINWQIAMIAIRMKKFYKKTGRRVCDGKTPVGFDEKKLECFNCHKTCHFAREYDGIVNWGEHTEDEEINQALMAISSSSEANEIYEKDEKDEKLKKYRRIGMKAVNEKEQLQKILDSWKDSSKNLWRLINSGMSSNSKIGLGYEIKSNNEVLSYEEEMNFFVFKGTEEDSVGKPLYSRFIKANDFKGGPQEPEPNVSDDRSSEYSTCQSNDSARSIGTSFEHTVDLESEISRVPSEVQPIKDQATPKVNRKNWNALKERELGEGYSFIKKKFFVYGSLSHLIKDCDYYEKKMAKEAEVKKQRVCNTDQNRDMVEFCGNKGIKQEYSNARTPQQNGVAERMNRTLIEAVRTMLADLLLPTTFWAEAVSTACYIFNKVEVNLHVNFLEEKPNVKGVGYRWMFDIDYLTDSMNYIPVSLENQTNPHAGNSELTNS
ncbi:retrovirus-related pol polyprotein from transposon TNT 1-94 [Tanacetum coccineum]|uniref:Retrovirus-related pol polyprotein from transposon TNT 1-94 n=1 Tax=Tanacetum coccineum TaxID=301880 RepID=A0ABQ5JDP5_9ASTR